MKFREAIFLFLIFGWAMCGPACVHEQPSPIAHDVSACLAPCAGASAVITAEVPEKGTMCRCWAPNAFSYTFSYPVTAEDFEYARQRWTNGIKAAEQCRRKGLGWEPDATRDNVICVKPAADWMERPPAPHTSLGRLRPGDWPRFVHRPAWMQWRTPSRAS